MQAQIVRYLPPRSQRLVVLQLDAPVAGNDGAAERIELRIGLEITQRGFACAHATGQAHARGAADQGVALGVLVADLGHFRGQVGHIPAPAEIETILRANKGLPATEGIALAFGAQGRNLQQRHVVGVGTPLQATG